VNKYNGKDYLRKIVLFVYSERRCGAWVVVMAVVDWQTVVVPAALVAAV
jgi:hypothetical protein